MTHPIPAEELARARELLDAGRSLPNSWYTSAEILAVERRTLFSKSWLYFGHESQIAGPGLRGTWGALLDYAESNNVATGLVPVARDEQVIDANWKTLVDNVIECYHCAPIHPQLAEVFDVGVKGTALTEFACGSAIELR